VPHSCVDFIVSLLTLDFIVFSSVNKEERR